MVCCGVVVLFGVAALGVLCHSKSVHAAHQLSTLTRMRRHLLRRRDLWVCCCVVLLFGVAALGVLCHSTCVHDAHQLSSVHACGVISLADAMSGCAVASWRCVVWLRLACCATARECTPPTS